MGVEVRPLGVTCNLACQYCYQNPQRDAGNLTGRYDLDAMKRAILAEGQHFTLFGGEPLLVPEADLEELFRFGHERFGRNGIQTNGALINDEHIRLFRQYAVSVGISVDGPGELNDARWQGTLAATRAATERTHQAIARLCAEGMPPALIVTLHRANATPDRLPLLHDWVREMDRLGVKSIRLHPLEVEGPEVRDKYALSTAENLQVLLGFARLEAELPRLRFDLFSEQEYLLSGSEGRASCVWRACDPYTTAAVRGIEGSGQRSNCGRTNKDGVDFSKADQPGYERYVALYHTPQEHGGCQGCRFFLQCKGQCPGTAIDGDWRNRTEHCELWTELFQHVEERLLKRGITPLSLQPYRAAVEAETLRAWARGQSPPVEDTIRRLSAGEGGP